jgi:hypothetical protein
VVHREVRARSQELSVSHGATIQLLAVYFSQNRKYIEKESHLYDEEYKPCGWAGIKDRVIYQASQNFSQTGQGRKENEILSSPLKKIREP